MKKQASHKFKKAMKIVILSIAPVLVLLFIGLIGAAYQENFLARAAAVVTTNKNEMMVFRFVVYACVIAFLPEIIKHTKGIELLPAQALVGRAHFVIMFTLVELVLIQDGLAQIIMAFS